MVYLAIKMGGYFHGKPLVTVSHNQIKQEPMALTNLKKTHIAQLPTTGQAPSVNVQMGGYPPPPVKSWMKSGPS